MTEFAEFFRFYIIEGYKMNLKGGFTMTEEYILNKGYRKYPPTEFDSDIVVCKYQKRFDDEIGKKYFIDILKYNNSFVPKEKRTEPWEEYSYEYETQVTFGNKQSTIDFTFFADWTLEAVEQFLADFFDKMGINYYEIGDERNIRPSAKQI